MICVHRGLWGPLAENSLPAIAAAHPFEIIEIDAQLASDGVPVVIHDTTLDRTCGVPGAVREMPSKTLGGYTLLSGAGGADAQPTDTTLPNLTSALRTRPKGAFFDIDVKHPNEIEPIAAYLQDHGLADTGSLKIDTSQPADIEHLLSLQNRYGIMVMAKVDLAHAAPGHIVQLAAAGVAAAELTFTDLDQVRAACAAAGPDMACSAYTLNVASCCDLHDAAALADPDAVWGQLLDAGVTILMTDEPAALADYLATRP